MEKELERRKTGIRKTHFPFTAIVKGEILLAGPQLGGEETRMTLTCDLEVKSTGFADGGMWGWGAGRPVVIKFHARASG